MSTTGTRRVVPGPRTSVMVASVAAAISQVLIWLLEIIPAVGDVPLVIQAAITVIVVAAITYLVPSPQ